MDQSQTIHAIRKEQATANQPVKHSYDTQGRSRSPMKGRSEYQRQYPGVAGKSPSNLRTPDNLKFGDVGFTDTTQRTAFPDPNTNPGTREIQQRTQGLKLNIKEEGRFGHIFKDKEEHPDRYKKPQVDGEVVVKTGRWVQGKEQKQDLPFNGSTSNKRDYRGHSPDQVAKRQNERFDNLKPAQNSQIVANTNYQEKHGNGGKQPDNLTTSKLHDMNKTLDRRAEPNVRAYGADQRTTYQREHSRTPTKEAVAREDNLRSTLHQMHNGYYHPEQ